MNEFLRLRFVGGGRDEKGKAGVKA